MDLFLVVWIATCLLIEVFFSGSEIAIVSCDKIKMTSLAGKGSKGARLLERMLNRPEWLLGTVLVGTNIAVAANTIMVSLTMIRHYPHLGELVTVAVMSPLVLFFGELLPKSFFQQKADVLAPRVIFPIWLASRLFYPFLILLTKAGHILSRGQWAQERPERFPLTREDFKTLLRMSPKGSDLKIEERRMVDRLFALSDTTVEKVMIPLVDVAALPETATWSEASSLILQEGHSRIPVYRGRIVHIIGILTHFELLHAKDRNAPVSSLVRPAFYVPETKRVLELLLQMKKKGQWMAVAVDEYGGAVGIVTVEDIVEEIVGEIDDEYDPRRSLYKKLDARTFVIDGRIEIDYINEKLPFEIPEGEYETLGGFLLTKMGRIPEPGETFTYGTMLFTIQKATPRSIREIKLTLLTPMKLRT